MALNSPELTWGQTDGSLDQSYQALRRTVQVTDGDGLYLMAVPTGGRNWRYNYRFDGKQKTHALGIYPDVPLEGARARH